MSEHTKVYGICENKCKVPVYSQEQSDNRYAMNGYELSVDTTAWATDSATGYYRAVVTNYDVTANKMVDVVLDINSVLLSAECGLMPYSESFSGYFCLYAESVPSAVLTGKYYVKEVL